ncbi:MAG TPA: DsbA family protein [Candidatus Thermoplasmatota archaeon]|nr:DsbA family protein [Candidatus Thermoplasmatota archaeon]
MRRVDVWYDFAVPLCFVAHERARRWAALPAEVAWLPWETAPGTPADGRPRRPGEDALPQDVAAAFARERLAFKASPLVPNARVALRGAIWVEGHATGERDVAADFRDGVFRRLYERGLDSHLGNAEVLAGLVERAGLDPIVFLDDMKAGAGEAELRAHGERAKALGLRQAPTVVVDGAVQESLDAAERAVRG